MKYSLGISNFLDQWVGISLPVQGTLVRFLVQEDLFRKIRYTKGTFNAKMGSIKDRNGMDLTEAEDIKKRWQEYTELYKIDLHRILEWVAISFSNA